jgi:lysophospholipase L1-like esterase
MKTLKHFLIIVFLTSLITGNTFAQQKPNFWDDMQTIKRYDKIYAPPQNPILFIGSSSIRKWNTTEAFKNHVVLNRGIGGAVVADIDYYVEDLIVPYNPRQIVLYVGENDIISAANGDSIFVAFKKLYWHIRVQLPEVPIVYISIKPSPSRKAFFPLAIRANQLTHDFIEAEKNIVFIDAYKSMLDKDGNARPELFVNDMLHLNTAGYKLWHHLVSHFLLKN